MRWTWKENDRAIPWRFEIVVEWGPEDVPKDRRPYALTFAASTARDARYMVDLLNRVEDCGRCCDCGGLLERDDKPTGRCEGCYDTHLERTHDAETAE